MDAFAKAGLMIRETLEDSARNVFLSTTPDHGWFVQRPYDSCGGTASSGSETVSTYPFFLRIRPLGDLINCYRSDDGTSYDRVSTTVKLDNLSPDVFIGFAVTAQHEGTLTHADFDRIVVQ
jgi:hypothetical protein